jgi:hypothetical protein
VLGGPGRAVRALPGVRLLAEAYGLRAHRGLVADVPVAGGPVPGGGGGMRRPLKERR